MKWWVDLCVFLSGRELVAPGLGSPCGPSLQGRVTQKRFCRQCHSQSSVCVILTLWRTHTEKGTRRRRTAQGILVKHIRVKPPRPSPAPFRLRNLSSPKLNTVLLADVTVLPGFELCVSAITYTFRVRPLSLCGSPFHSLKPTSWWTEFLLLRQVNYLIFSFTVSALCLLEVFFPTFRPSSYSLSFRCFVSFLPFIFWSKLHLELFLLICI